MILSHCSTGGMPQVACKRIELIKNDVDVYVVEFDNISNDFVIQKNRLKKLLKPDHFFTLGQDKYELLSIIDKIDPDYIHFEEMPELFNISYDLASEIYKTNRKYKIFETTHSSDFNTDDKIFYPDKFLFVSQYNCYKFNKFGIPTEVIEYPVERQKISQEEKLNKMKKLGLDPGYKHVVNIGLFTPRKNQAYAFDIARILIEEPIKFHFIGNQADNFKSYWEPLLKNKPENCILWGERDDVDDFLDACDLFLFTSMGFRWNKELNPLVIKEAIQHQIPQFLFPLDVYNRKYDQEDTINYLKGDSDIDARLINNFLFDRKNMPWESTKDTKYKIRAVHLIREDEKTNSIKDIEKLKDFGIDYVQHKIKKFFGDTPKEFCARPNDIGKIGAHSLRNSHYENYLSFKRAILSEFTDDVDFLIVFEPDCIFNNITAHGFVEKVLKSCDIILKERIYVMSFGEDKNIRTGLDNSIIERKIDGSDISIIKKMIDTQSVIFPKFAKKFINNAFDTVLWDTTEAVFNDMFNFKTKAINPGLITKGASQGQIIMDRMKTKEDLLKDKNPGDIIVEYKKSDNRFHFCLSEFFEEREIPGIKIVVHMDDKKNVFDTLTSLSPLNSIWIELYGAKDHNNFYFDFYHNNEFLFTKVVELKNIKNEKKISVEDIDNLVKNMGEDDSMTNPNMFKVTYDNVEEKIYLSYNGNGEPVLNLIIKNIKNGYVVYDQKNTKFSKTFNNWIKPDNRNSYGYEILYKNAIDDNVLFTKELKLTGGEKPKKEYVAVNGEESINNFTAATTESLSSNDVYLVLTYPDTTVKEEITKQCIESLKQAGKTVILASHCPVSKQLQELSDYYIYDSYNPLIQHTLYNYYWSNIPEGKVEIYLDKIDQKSNLNQSLTVLNNIKNAVSFSKEIGARNLISVSYDFILDKKDIEKIDSLINEMKKENKKGYFMKYNEGDMDLLKSVFFITNINFFDVVFSENPRSPERFNKECEDLHINNFLENYFYKKLINYKDKILIEETDEEILFNNSKINLFSGVEYLTLLPVKNDEKSFVVWFNSSNTKDNRRIEFKYGNRNEIEKSTHYIKNRTYYIKKITMNESDNYFIIAEFIDSVTNTIIDKKEYRVNLKNISELKKNGIFTDKNNNNNNENVDRKIEDNIEISFDPLTNNINFKVLHEDFKGKITVLDDYSKTAFHWGECDIKRNVGYYINPIPKYAFDFEEDQYFNGFEIRFYDMEDNLLFSKNIQTKKHDLVKIDAVIPDGITPFDCLYFLWRDFFVNKVYDDFLNKIYVETVLDLGANQGLFTYLMVTRGAEKIYAVEAVKKCCDNMRKMFKDNDNVIIINKAVSDYNSQVKIFVNKANTTVSCRDIDKCKKHLPNSIDGYEEFFVDGITINELIKQQRIDKIDLMKVDIEGDEYLLFDTITYKNLSRIENMIIEYHHNYNNELDLILNRLKEHNFYYFEFIADQNGGGTIFASKKNVF